MYNDDERDYAEEAYNRAEMEREAQEEYKDMHRTVITLSDTSHPFTAYVSEQPKWEPSWHNQPNRYAISADEVKPLEYDETDIERINAQTARRELFREEADKRVNRYFIGQTGWAWFVHFVVEMPEWYDMDGMYKFKSYMRAEDGRTLLMMTSLYMSEEKAWEAINADISFTTSFDAETLTHVTELDKM